MLYNVPYIPDPGYTTFLAGLSETLHSVHYSLYSPLLNDGRVRVGGVALDELTRHLQQLPAPRKYLLANGRFHSPAQYLGRDRLAQLVDQLSLLQEARVLDGIVFSDTYLLMALAKQAPTLVAKLEAVPSINFVFDNIEKIVTLIQTVQQSGFLPPAKLTFDRELNRQPQKLKNLVLAIRSRFPAMKIELLANEGCLRHCPFRATHEALIAAANSGVPVDTLHINQQLGCVQILSKEPHRILVSPFIRPEDICQYESVVDIIKICGRSLGADFLARTVQSYFERRSPNNQLSLLDAAHWMTDYWDVAGKKLPGDFYQQMATCDGNCEDCQICRKLFERAATTVPFKLKNLAKSC